MTKGDVPPAPISDFLGTWRRFGLSGPVYQVLGPSRAPGKVDIKVLASGEDLTDDTARAALDPGEA